MANALTSKQNRPLILPHMQRHFLAPISLIFAAAGDITNTVKTVWRAGSMSRIFLDVYGQMACQTGCWRNGHLKWIITLYCNFCLWPKTEQTKSNYLSCCCCFVFVLLLQWHNPQWMEVFFANANYSVYNANKNKLFRFVDCSR